MSASLWIQRANSSRSIMWLLVKSSFDINYHILSLFLRNASWMEFFTCLTPFFSLTSSLKLTWLQFSLFDLYTLNTMSVLLCLAECACIVERTSNVTYSSNVLEVLGDVVLMMAAWYAQYPFLLCKMSPTAWSSMWLQDQWPFILWVRQDLQSHQMLHYQPWRLHSLAQEPGQ